MRRIEQLYPLTKLVLVLMLSVLTFLLHDFRWNALLFMLILLVAFINGNGKALVWQTLKTFSFLLIILFVLQALFFASGEYDLALGPIQLKSLGIVYAANLSFILLVIGSSFLFLFESTEIKELVYSLESMGMNKKFAYVLTMTFQMVPELKKQTGRIMLAQEARGMQTTGSLKKRISAYLPIMGTLLMSTIVSTEERALTLQARGFSLNTQKTYLYELTDTKKDRWLRRLAVVVVAIVMGVKFYLWRTLS